MKTTPAHDLQCLELGLSASTAVSVVKHCDPFQLICLFRTNVLKFIGFIHCQRRRGCDERFEQSGAWRTDREMDGLVIGLTSMPYLR
jgi:hypothetical protein